jgi:hypothetical protein
LALAALIMLIIGGPLISCIRLTVWPASGAPVEDSAMPDSFAVLPGTRPMSIAPTSCPTPTFTRCASAAFGVFG